MNPDSLIFDMDGTLWDAVDTYAFCWNAVLKDNGIDRVITRNDLQKYMGMEAKQIYREVFPDLPEETIEKLYTDTIIKTDKFLPLKGGVLYPDVVDCIKELSTKYKLFMLSNCQKGSINDFLNYADLSKYFLDYIEYGLNFQPKNINMKLLIDRHHLKSPLYIGDTESDRKQSNIANIPFAFASWGFGKCELYAYKFDNMKELTNYFMNLDPNKKNLANPKPEKDIVSIEDHPISEKKLDELKRDENIEVIKSIDELEHNAKRSEKD